MRKILLLVMAIALYAGPPMLTNDPFLPEKDFEINVAVHTEQDDKSTTYVPILDINYVAMKNLELTLYSTYKTVDSEKEKKSDFSITELAFKYQFFNNNTITTALVGGYRFSPMKTMFDEEEEYELQLPINYQINQKLHFVFTTTYIHPMRHVEEEHVEFGSYIEYEVAKNKFYIEALEHSKEKSELYYLMNFGHMYEFNSRYSTLFSIGKTLKSETPEEEARFAYIGLQIRL